MKKSRILALALVLALMMIGTAYAAWTQTVTVATTVETGELRIDVEALTGQDATMRFEGGNWAGNGQEDASLTLVDATATVLPNDQSDTSVTVTGTNFFPGTEIRIGFDLANRGSIPADLIFSTVDNMPTDDIYYWVYPKLTSEGVVTKPFGNEIKRNDIDDVIAVLNEITLDPGEVLTVYMRIGFEGSATEVTLEELESYSFDFNVDVSQFNID